MPVTPITPSKWSRTAHQARSRRTLEQILDAAERLMATRPFRAISVAEIAQEAGASISSLYARFADKDALLGAIYERHARHQRGLVDRLFEPARWDGLSVGQIVRQTFPRIVAGYRARQGLIRAFLERASDDVRFRDTWSEIGEHIIERITVLVMARLDEIDHPDPPLGVRLGLAMAFATLAHQIQMHQIDSPQMDELSEELIRMMLRYMGITSEAAR